MLGASFAIDVVFAGRSGVAGLAGFVTLPCREVVALWQVASIFLGAACVVAVSLVYSASTAGASAGVGDDGGAKWGTSEGGPGGDGLVRATRALLGAIGGAELLRLACFGFFAALYPTENLAAP